MRRPSITPWREIRRMAAPLCAVALLAACGGDEAVEAAPPPVPKVAPKKEAAAPVEDAAAAFTYNAIGKRDPFRSYFAELEKEDRNMRKFTPLQMFDLDQLNLVAVVTGIATPKALVEDPTGLGHVVKIGTLLGKHWGQVKHIRQNEIIVQEEFRDFTGRRVTHLVPMKLPEENIEELQ